MIWLIGTGPMARDYARVLQALGRDFLVIGRNSQKAQDFAQEFSQNWLAGGAEAALAQVESGQLNAPDFAIVSTQVSELAKIANMLLPVCPRILLEKPGAAEVTDMQAIASQCAVQNDRRVYVGYNRRFLPSVAELRRRIATEGPVLSIIAEFDEPIPRIEALPTEASIKARWGFANASHVLDLVWHLCGQPVQNSRAMPKSLGPSLPWHPSGSVFVGSGVTTAGTQYLYHGNYSSVGRWRLALSLPRRRYLLSPLETLEMVEGNSVMPVKIETPSQVATHLKPGLCEQVEAFLSNDPDDLLPSAAYQLTQLTTLAHIFGYPA